MPRSSLLREMWPVLSMMRLLGWLPAHRRHDSDTLHVRSAWLVYCGVVLTVQLVPAMYIVFKGIQLTSGLDPGLQFLSYFQLVFGLLLPQLLPFFAVTQAPLHVNFINDMTKFQLDVERVSVSRRTLVFGTSRLSLVTAASYFVSGVVILVVKPLLLGDLPNLKIDVIRTLGVGNLYLLLGWWVVAMKSVRVSSERLINEYKLLREYNEAGRQLDQLAMSTRPLWLQLCRLVRGSGDALAFPQGFCILYCIAILMFSLYTLLNGQAVDTAIFLTILTVACSSFIYVVCFEAHSCKENVHQDLLEAMKVTKNLRISFKIKEKMVKLFTHLCERSPEVTFSGYIAINRGYAATLVAALLTNLVVFYQLNFSERRLSVSEYFSFGDEKFVSDIFET